MCSWLTRATRFGTSFHKQTNNRDGACEMSDGMSDWKSLKQAMNEQVHSHFALITHY